MLLRVGVVALAWFFAACAASVVPAQEPAPAASAPPKFRKLAPGVMRLVERSPSVGDTFSYHDVLDLLQMPAISWKNEFTPTSQTLGQMLKKVPFRREIWELEFAYKPVRYLEALVPDENGKVVARRVWYMIYRVRNPGGVFTTTLDEVSGLPVAGEVDKPVKFIPKVWLKGEDVPAELPDRLLPVVIPAIERREDPNRRLLDTISISQNPIPVDPNEEGGVWGVLTWDNVDPRTDKFSIYIQGLTNSYQWVDQAVGENADGTKTYRRRYAVKTLKLSFWRPGDEFEPAEREIRIGAPGEKTHQWMHLEVE